MSDLLLTNKWLFTSHYVNWWTAWSLYQLFGLWFWRHPFTAERVMQCYISLNQFCFIFIFRWTFPLNITQTNIISTVASISDFTHFFPLSVIAEEGSAGRGVVWWWRGGSLVVCCCVLHRTSNPAWIHLPVFFKWIWKSEFKLNWGTKLCRKLSLLCI